MTTAKLPYRAPLAAAALLGLAACSAKPAAQNSAQGPEAYTPGLGEIMGLNQMRHAKLWFAGQAQNWPLTAYETDELREGFADAMKYDPTHEGVPRPITELVPEFVEVPLGELDAAIKQRDKAAFTKAFDDLTAGCNGCHHAANFAFNVITRPTSPPFSNQRFEPLPDVDPARH